MRDVRYDRQLRLWGEEGQQSIEQTSVYVLGSSALATEIVKSLVLAGVQSVSLVDDAIVEMADLGNNFFLEEDQIGKPRAEAVAHWLQELNPSVFVRCVLSNPKNLNDHDILSFSKSSVVVSCNLNETIASKISSVLYRTGTPLIHCRVYGLLGYARICAREHTIANSHAENPKPDLRLDCPFPALQDMCDEMDLKAMAPEEFKHTPYIFLYMKALEEYRAQLGDEGAFPDTYAKRKEFLRILMHLRTDDEAVLDAENLEEAKQSLNRSVQRTTVSSELRSIFDSPHCADESNCAQPFWLICAGLKKFVEKHGVLPLSGSLPDMTSDSKRYSRLASLFHEKATSDAEEVLQLTREVEQSRGAEDVISPNVCLRFCRNARFIAVQTGSCLTEELAGTWQKAVEELVNGWCEEDEVTAAEWYLLLRAVDRFEQDKKRFPGTNGVPVSLDTHDVKERLVALIEESQMEDKSAAINKIHQKAVEEMCRYGSSEPHVAAAYLGGMVAQEVIKLATNQYVPLDNTLILDMHSQKSATFRF